MVGEGSHQTRGQALIQQNAHGGAPNSGGRCTEECLLGEFERRDRLIVGHGGKILEKVDKGMSTFQIVDEGLDGNPCANEHWGTSEDLWIAMNYWGQARHRQLESRGRPEGTPQGGGSLHAPKTRSSPRTGPRLRRVGRAECEQPGMTCHSGRTMLKSIP